MREKRKLRLNLNNSGHNKAIIVVIAAAVFGMCGCTNAREVAPSVAVSEETALQDSLRQFISSIASKNIANISFYFRPQNRQSSNGWRIDEDTESFLFAETLGDETVSISKIIAKGEIITRINKEPDGTLSVIFVPASLSNQVTKKEFLESQFMINYFACDFTFDNHILRLSRNYCYEGTGGPYEVDDPNL